MPTFLFSLWGFMSACVRRGKRNVRQEGVESGRVLIGKQPKRILADYTEGVRLRMLGDPRVVRRWESQN